MTVGGTTSTYIGGITLAGAAGSESTVTTTNAAWLASLGSLSMANNTSLTYSGADAANYVGAIVTGTGVAGTSVATSSTSFFYDIPADGSPTKQAMAWKQGFLDVSFAAAGNYTLWFRGNAQFGNQNQGAALDSVTLDAAVGALGTAVVPLPAASWLMLAGMGMVFGLGRRRRFASA
jgi:hypothetical protein